MIKKLLSTLIILELLCSFTGLHYIKVIKSTTVMATDCSDGMEFNASLNRCVLKKEVISTKIGVQECEGLEGEAKSSCFKGNAEEKLKDVPESKGPKSQMMLPMIVTLGVGYSMLTKSALYTSCSSTSLMLMLGGGLSSIIGELISQSKYKKALKSAQERYKERAQSEDYKDKETIDITTMNQVAAFDFQIEQEKARRSAHKTRKTIYMLASVMYTGAAAMAIFEATSRFGTGTTGCATANQNFTPNIDLEKLKHYAKIIYDNTLNFTPSAEASQTVIIHRSSQQAITHASTQQVTTHASSQQVITHASSQTATSTATGPLTNAATNATLTTEPMTTAARKNLWITAAISGLLAGYSMNVSSKASKEQKISEKRVKALEELKKEFIASGGAGFGFCTDGDRRSPSKPACYCYLENGTQNPIRKNSTICSAIFGKAELTSASDYNLKSDDYITSRVKGCTTKAGSVDMKCDCKKEKDKNSKSSCIEFSGKLNLGPLALNKNFKDAVGNASNFVNGKISTGDLDSASLERLAIRINKGLDKAIKKDPKLKKANKKISKLKDKLKINLSRRVAADYRAGKLADFEKHFFGDESATQTDTAKTIAKKRVKSLKKEARVVALPTPRIKKKNFDDFFDDKKSGVVVDESLVDMNAEYEIDDINKNKHHNIFQIISNRYLMSGLPRLFDEKGIIKAEKASEK